MIPLIYITFIYVEGSSVSECMRLKAVKLFVRKVHEQIIRNIEEKFAIENWRPPVNYTHNLKS